MMRASEWLLTNAAFVSLVWFGVHLNDPNAYNLFVFWLWLKFIFSFFSYMDSVKQSYIAKGKPIVPSWLNSCVDIAVTAFLAWHGQHLFAVLYLMHFINLGTLEIALKNHLKGQS